MKVTCPSCSGPLENIQADKNTGECPSCKQSFAIDQLFLQQYNTDHKEVQGPLPGISFEQFEVGYHIDVVWREIGNWKMRLIFGAIATPILTIIVLWTLGDSVIVTLLMGLLTLVAGTSLLQGLQLYFGRSTIRLSNDQLHIAHVFPMFYQNDIMTIGKHEIEQLYVTQNDGGKLNDRQLFEYSLMIRTTEGKRHHLFRCLKTPEIAHFIERSLEQQLGLPDFMVSGEFHPDKAPKDFTAEASKVAAQQLYAIKGLSTEGADLQCPGCGKPVADLQADTPEAMKVCQNCSQVFHTESLAAPLLPEVQQKSFELPDNLTFLRLDNSLEASIKTGKKVHLFFMAFSSLLFLMAWNFTYDASRIPLLLMGSAACYAALRAWLSRVTFKASKQELVVSNFPTWLFQTNKQNFTKTSIKQLYVQRRIVKDDEGRKTRYYDLILLDQQAIKHMLLENRSSPQAIQFVEKQIESFLEIKDEVQPDEYVPERDGYHMGLKDVVDLLRKHGADGLGRK